MILQATSRLRERSELGLEMNMVGPWGQWQVDCGKVDDRIGPHFPELAFFLKIRIFPPLDRFGVSFEFALERCPRDPLSIASSKRGNREII
jgi:hypothetical protein